MSSLPLNQKYTLLSSKYTGGLENGAGFCSNCGRVITNIATIKSEKGDVYDVGMDCMKTLTSLFDNPLDVYNATMDFVELKRLQNKIRKAKKDYPNLKIEPVITNDGIVRFETDVLVSGSLKWSIFYIDLSFVKKYMPEYIPFIKNPELLNVDFKLLKKLTDGVLVNYQSFFKALGKNGEIFNSLTFGFTLPNVKELLHCHVEVSGDSENLKVFGNTEVMLSFNQETQNFDSLAAHVGTKVRNRFVEYLLKFHLECFLEKN